MCDHRVPLPASDGPAGGGRRDVGLVGQSVLHGPAQRCQPEEEEMTKVVCVFLICEPEFVLCAVACATTIGRSSLALDEKLC